MFGRVTIRLGIGPHSSSLCETIKVFVGDANEILYLFTYG